VDLWTYDTASRRRSRLTDVQGEEYSAVITSDNQVIFAAWRGVSGVYRVPLLGGREDLLKFASGVQNLQAWSISPDDRWLAVSGDGQDQSDLGIVDLTTTPHTVTWMVNSRFTERRGIFSPTGTHVAYESDQLGRTDVWVSRFSNGRMTAAVPVSRDGGIDAFWSRDGRALYYTSGSTLMKVDIGAGDTVTALPPRAVLDLKATRVFGIGPDGRFIAVRRERAPVTHLDVILNWTEEIRQRVK
jgi:Tol biopolymer transport system component